MNTLPLEQKIIAALGTDTTSAALETLLNEAEDAIVAADESAKLEAERALDPVLSPDPVEARTAMEAAGFAADRLRTLRPRLQARLFDLQAQERLTQWNSDADAPEARRDALAAELREVYQDFQTKIPDLFTRIAANDDELSSLVRSRPLGAASRRLLSAELVARGLESFSREQPPLGKELALPDWRQPTQLAWPARPRKPLSVLMAEAIAFNPPQPRPLTPQYGAERAVAVAAEQEAVARFYDERARERQARENAEVQQHANRPAAGT